MSEPLQNLVAELLAIPRDQVGPDRVLSGARLQGSLGRSILDAALRRKLGIQTPACYTAKTYGELEAAVNGSAVAPATNGSAVASPVEGTKASSSHAAKSAPVTPLTTPSAPARIGSSFAPSSCGVDIELIGSMPATADFWSHEFYTTNFTPAEIAYCLTQQDPPHHFAARWCAKEALKKCEPALLSEAMRNLEVFSHPDGHPTLRHTVNGSLIYLPHSLSLSHTSHAAVAMVMRVSSPTPPPPIPASAKATAHATPIIAPQRPGKSGMVAMMLSLMAFALAAAALAVAIHHR